MFFSLEGWSKPKPKLLNPKCKHILIISPYCQSWRLRWGISISAFQNGENLPQERERTKLSNHGAIEKGCSHIGSPRGHLRSQTPGARAWSYLIPSQTNKAKTKQNTTKVTLLYSGNTEADFLTALFVLILPNMEQPCEVEDILNHHLFSTSAAVGFFKKMIQAPSITDCVLNTDVWPGTSAFLSSLLLLILPSRCCRLCYLVFSCLPAPPIMPTFYVQTPHPSHSARTVLVTSMHISPPFYDRPVDAFLSKELPMKPGSWKQLRSRQILALRNLQRSRVPYLAGWLAEGWQARVGPLSSSHQIRPSVGKVSGVYLTRSISPWPSGLASVTVLGSGPVFESCTRRASDM